jgi:hypothetical protein
MNVDIFVDLLDNNLEAADTASTLAATASAAVAVAGALAYASHHAMGCHGLPYKHWHGLAQGEAATA